MADEPSGLPEIPVERRFPWVRVFRGVGVSIDARKILLAMLGLVAYSLGRDGIDRLLPPAVGRPSPMHPRLIEPPDRTSPWSGYGLMPDLASVAWRLAEPARTLVDPFVGFFAIGNDGIAFLRASLAALWGAVVWGIIGGAIARMAVVQVVRTDRIGLGEALRFARGKWPSLVGTPLTPLLGVAFLASACAVFGLLYRLPGTVGPTVAGVFTIFPLLAGLVMTIVLISLAVSWPLMHATIAAEGEDGFDALSRSFAYVHQRPGRYAAYVALAWLLGIFGWVVVDLFARTTIHMAHWALGFGAPDAVLAALFRGAKAGVAPASRGAHAFWLSAVGLAAHAWIYAYFWTSAAIIYLVLRQDVDGTPWHVIAVPERKPFEFATGPTPTAGPAGPPGPEPAADPATPSTAVAPDADANAPARS